MAKDWSDCFPHGHFLEVYWPMTKASYPKREEDHSWRVIEDIANKYA